MWIFGDFNGSAKDVSFGIADESFDGAFGDSKVDGFGGVFDNVHFSIFDVRIFNIESSFGCFFFCLHVMITSSM